MTRTEWHQLKEHLRQIGREVRREVAKVLLCPLGFHEVSVAHPHYCARCGHHYGLRK